MRRAAADPLTRKGLAMGIFGAGGQRGRAAAKEYNFAAHEYLQELCDKCHAAWAKVEVITSAGSLFFCQHHHEKYRHSVIAAGHQIRAVLGVRRVRSPGTEAAAPSATRSPAVARCERAHPESGPAGGPGFPSLAHRCRRGGGFSRASAHDHWVGAMILDLREAMMNCDGSRRAQQICLNDTSRGSGLGISWMRRRPGRP
jgi:hypothetical protein